MAGAREYMLRRPIKCRTRGVSAKTAESDKRTLRRMQEEAWMLVIRVGNDLHAANGYVFHLGYHLDWIRILSSADQDDQSAKSGGDAGGS
jgi:hypothetical protein